MSIIHRNDTNNQFWPCTNRALRSQPTMSVRYALRNLRKRPVFSLIVIFTLALGIGANTAIFSVIDAVLLSPLPYGDPDKLVVLGAKNDKLNLTQQPVSYPNIVDLKQAQD